MDSERKRANDKIREEGKGKGGEEEEEKEEEGPAD